MILYVTRTGTSRGIAEKLGLELGAPVHEIVDLVKRKGLLGFIKSGYQASSKQATPIQDPMVDLAGVRYLIFVQPVWASAVTPPLRTWMRGHQTDLAGKKLGLLCTNLGSPGDRVLAAWNAEFAPLAAFTVVSAKISATAKSDAIRSFLSQLRA